MQAKIAREKGKKISLGNFKLNSSPIALANKPPKCASETLADICLERRSSSAKGKKEKKKKRKSEENWSPKKTFSPSSLDHPAKKILKAGANFPRKIAEPLHGPAASDDIDLGSVKLSPIRTERYDNRGEVCTTLDISRDRDV